MGHTPPLLHRNDPDRDPLVGHVKVTREDWTRAARDVLIHQGVAHVKILPLSVQLGVSRSSFYWYFENRADLLASLLDAWEARNTAQIVSHCLKPAPSITHALCNFFECFVDERLFDRGLDFAVREWARRDSDVRVRVDDADARRITAVIQMFQAQGYEPVEADARARILYFMQLGYHALEVREDMDLRLSRVGPYIEGFSGSKAEPEALAQFEAKVRRLNASNNTFPAGG